MPHAITVIDGVTYPSVTTITGIKPKPWLDEWLKKPRSAKIVKLSSQIGTAFHALIEKRLEYEYIDGPITKRLRAMFREFSEWAYTNEIVTIYQDMRVVSKAHCYSGTLDWIGYHKDYPDELIIIDWKTSKGIYEDMDLQLVAYAKAYEEQTGEQIKRGLIVNIPKKHGKHKIRIREFKLTKHVFSRFLKLREDYREQHGE